MNVNQFSKGVRNSLFAVFPLQKLSLDEYLETISAANPELDHKYS